MVRLNINEPNSNSIAETAKASGITVFPNPATDVCKRKICRNQRRRYPAIVLQ